MKIKKVLSLALIATMILSMTVTPAFAASTTPNSTENVETGTFTDHADGTEAVEVTATVASTYTVTIPKKITMDGANKSADYTVTVSGDIADNEVVTVAPDASFLMNTAKGDKDAVTATIEQSKTEWKYNEFATQATGSISAPLTAGEWNGTFNFAISLEAEVELISFTVSGKSFQAEKDMTWGAWVNSEYNRPLGKGPFSIDEVTNTIHDNSTVCEVCYENISDPSNYIYVKSTDTIIADKNYTVL